MDRYTYRVTWSEEDNEYIGVCAEFPSLSWLAATQEVALTGIRETVKQVVADMHSSGEEIPPATVHQTLFREVYRSYSPRCASATPNTSCGS